MTKKKLVDAVVKIDADLLKEVEAYLNKKENKYAYVNKKQFINKAVYEQLNKERNKKKKR